MENSKNNYIYVKKIILINTDMSVQGVEFYYIFRLILVFFVSAVYFSENLLMDTQ